MLEKYKVITIKIIESLENDQDIDSLMEERGNILKEIEALNISKSDLIEEYKVLNVKEADEALYKLLESKIKEVKADINNSKQRRKAFTSYSSTNRAGNLFARKV